MYSTITRLKTEHDRLRELADRLDRFLDGDAAPKDANFTQLGWVLVQELSLHLASERAALRTHKENDVAQRFGLDEAFVRHVATWGNASVAAGWSRYVTETRLLLNALRDRMAFEEATIFPAVRYRRAP
ncbi:hemerythrin domain-containing protein [Sphingomonas sp. RS2018]